MIESFALDPVTLAVALGAFALAGAVKGLVGMGLPLTAISIMVTVVSPLEAIPLIVVPVIVTNIWQVVQGGALASVVARFWAMNVAACAGIWLGTIVLFALDPALLAAGLGAVVFAYSLINLLAVQVRLRPQAERRWGPAVGLLSGFLTGTTGSVGIPLVVFFQAIGFDRDTYLRAISLIFLVSGVFLGATLIGRGAFGWPQAAASTAALAPALAGMWVGQKLSGRLSPERFRACVFAVLLVVGAHLIAKTLY
ncbi:MAG: sulfite exporter TauE/SafE family protein [Rhodospirillales bacterium]